MDGAWEKYFGLLRTGSYAKNRWGSCGGSNFGWGSHIWKVMGRDVGKGMLESSQLIMIFWTGFLGIQRYVYGGGLYRVYYRRISLPNNCIKYFWTKFCIKFPENIFNFQCINSEPRLRVSALRARTAQGDTLVHRGPPSSPGQIGEEDDPSGDTLVITLRARFAVRVTTAGSGILGMSI